MDYFYYFFLGGGLWVGYLYRFVHCFLLWADYSTTCIFAFLAVQHHKVLADLTNVQLHIMMHLSAHRESLDKKKANPQILTWKMKLKFQDFFSATRQQVHI